MNVIDFRLDNRLAEKKEDGTTVHVDLEDVRRFWGEIAAAILEGTGQLRIVYDPSATIKTMYYDRIDPVDK
jgi:hypothetical protein